MELKDIKVGDVLWVKREEATSRVLWQQAVVSDVVCGITLVSGGTVYFRQPANVHATLPPEVANPPPPKRTFHVPGYDVEVPDGAKYWARDRDGSSSFYAYNPVADEAFDDSDCSGWAPEAGGGGYTLACDTNWRETLTEME